MRSQRAAAHLLVAATGLVSLSSCERRAGPLSPYCGSTILRAAAPVVIDGVLNEPCWREASPVRVDYVYSAQGKLSAEKRMEARYSWDERYLYVGYEVFDSNLVALGTGEMQGPEGNRREGCVIWEEGKKPDVVEFFVSFGDERFFWELHHNAANQFNDVWIVVPDPEWRFAGSSMIPYGIHFGAAEFVKDDGEHTLTTAVKLRPKADGSPSTVNDPSDTDAGYVGELRLPWRGLGAPADLETKEKKPGEKGELVSVSGGWRMSGHEVRILAAVQNYDLKERYHHSSPTAKFGWFHKGWADWPRYVFAEGAAAAGE